MLPRCSKVLVTGGTGFTGSLLVRRLCEAGCDVRVIARASSKRDHLADYPITWIEGNVYDEPVIAKAVQGVEYIFHVAAAYREAKITDDVYHKVHVTSTQILAQKARQQASLKRFIHVSTVGIHGHIEQPPADENASYNPGDIYQETKLEAELWLWEFVKQTNLPVTVIRPAAILGPQDRRLLKVFRMAIKPVVPLLGKGKCLYHLIHVEDLVRCMMIAATHPQALGEAFICGNEKPITLEEMISYIGSLCGKKPRFIRLPVLPFFIAGDVCEAVCKPLHIEPPIYRRRVAFFTKDRSFNTTKLRERLGYQYLYDNYSGIKSTLEGYKQAGLM